MGNQAKEWVAKFQGLDTGDEYHWLYDENDKVRKVPFSHLVVRADYSAHRYQFSDGSSIVNYECGWDFGIHKNHYKNNVVLDRCKEYELEPEFAWCAVVDLDEKFQNA